jgi:hypothetical protein
MAPGKEIASYVEIDRNAAPYGVALKQGTSMAAPHVSGVLALMLAQKPDLDGDQLISIIKRTARARSDSQCPGYCGAGMLDAYAALKEVSQIHTPPPIGPDPPPDRKPPNGKPPRPPKHPHPHPHPHPVKCYECICFCCEFDCDDDYEPDWDEGCE